MALAQLQQAALLAQVELFYNLENGRFIRPFFCCGATEVRFMVASLSFH
jgi:hypothetical protein